MDVSDAERAACVESMVELFVKMKKHASKTREEVHKACVDHENERIFQKATTKEGYYLKIQERMKRIEDQLEDELANEGAAADPPPPQTPSPAAAAEPAPAPAAAPPAPCALTPDWKLASQKMNRLSKHPLVRKSSLNEERLSVVRKAFDEPMQNIASSFLLKPSNATSARSHRSLFETEELADLVLLSHVVGTRQLPTRPCLLAHGTFASKGQSQPTSSFLAVFVYAEPSKSAAEAEEAKPKVFDLETSSSSATRTTSLLSKLSKMRTEDLLDLHPHVASMVVSLLRFFPNFQSKRVGDVPAHSVQGVDRTLLIVLPRNDGAIDSEFASFFYDAPETSSERKCDERVREHLLAHPNHVPLDAKGERSVSQRDLFAFFALYAESSKTIFDSGLSPVLKHLEAFIASKTTSSAHSKPKPTTTSTTASASASASTSAFFLPKKAAATTTPASAPAPNEKRESDDSDEETTESMPANFIFKPRRGSQPSRLIPISATATGRGRGRGRGRGTGRGRASARGKGASASAASPKIASKPDKKTIRKDVFLNAISGSEEDSEPEDEPTVVVKKRVRDPATLSTCSPSPSPKKARKRSGSGSDDASSESEDLESVAASSSSAPSDDDDEEEDVEDEEEEEDGEGEDEDEEEEDGDEEGPSAGKAASKRPAPPPKTSTPKPAVQTKVSPHQRRINDAIRVASANYKSLGVEKTIDKIGKLGFKTQLPQVRDWLVDRLSKDSEEQRKRDAPGCGKTSGAANPTSATSSSSSSSSSSEPASSSCPSQSAASTDSSSSPPTRPPAIMTAVATPKSIFDVNVDFLKELSAAFQGVQSRIQETETLFKNLARAAEHASAQIDKMACAQRSLLE